MNTVTEYDPLEIEMRAEETVPQGFYRIFNNLWMQFHPDHTRNVSMMLERWDTPFRVTAGDATIGYTSKKLAQTPRQFYGEIDLTIQELGIDHFALLTLISEFNIMVRTKDIPKEVVVATTQQLFDFLVLIYVALRKKGYSIRDIVG